MIIKTRTQSHSHVLHCIHSQFMGLLGHSNRNHAEGLMAFIVSPHCSLFKMYQCMLYERIVAKLLEHSL